ncbi:unnamed protein product, partial [Cuscuta epithymum]
MDDESWCIGKLLRLYKCCKRSRSYTWEMTTVQIQGIEKVELELTSRKKLILNDVYFVPQIRKNLVSDGILNNFLFKLSFEANKFILSKGGVFVGQSFYCNGMFKLSIVNKGANSVYMVCD